MGIVCDLPRIQSSRYDAGFAHRAQKPQLETTYRTLLTRLPHGLLISAYDTIEANLKV